MAARFRLSKTRQNGPFWHFQLTFGHSKCKCSSLRSRYWMRLFLWFSNTLRLPFRFEFQAWRYYTFLKCATVIWLVVYPTTQFWSKMTASLTSPNQIKKGVKSSWLWHFVKPTTKNSCQKRTKGVFSSSIFQIWTFLDTCWQDRSCLLKAFFFLGWLLKLDSFKHDEVLIAPIH